VSLASGEEVTLPHESRYSNARVSPDGRNLVYRARPKGQSILLRVVPVDGGDPMFEMDWTGRGWYEWDPD
jgi:dipeptidyl aminopeptidase/acylaminoacyl peptidase